MVYRKMKNSTQQPSSSASIENKKLQPIKLPPKSERKVPPSVQPKVRKKHQDWKNIVMVAAFIIIAVGGMLAMLFWFPSYRLAVWLLPAVTQEQIAAKSYYDWRGRRASDDIPTLTSAEQLCDLTYVTYLTLSTDEIIPLGLYKLKDSTDSRQTTTGRRRTRPLREYVNSPSVNAMSYGQYCLVKLEDGSYIGAYLDSSYATALGRVQLPVGQLEHADSREKALLAEAKRDYPVDTDRLLVLHSFEDYPDSILKLLDIGIRIAATALVVPVVLGGWVVVALLRKKGTTIKPKKY